VVAWLPLLTQFSFSPDYTKAFRENEIRGSSLVELDKGDLKDLGVAKLGHQIDIIKQIKLLIEKENVRCLLLLLLLLLLLRPIAFSILQA
jgi:hypothetical protein